MVYGQHTHVVLPLFTSWLTVESLYREPDLSKNPSEPQVLHVPSHTGNALLEREGVRRRPPIAKLHCKAFQFPVSTATKSLDRLWCIPRYSPEVIS